MQTIDLTEFDDGFVLHFGGDQNRINVDTFAKSMLELSSALKEINKTVNFERDVEIYIEATGK